MSNFELPTSWAPTDTRTTAARGTRIVFLNCLAHVWSDEPAEAFERRLTLHFDHLRATAPSVLGLCEVDSHHSIPGGAACLPRRLLEAWEADGQATWVLLRDGKAGGGRDTTCLLLDTSAVQLVQFEPLRFPDRGNVALVALLRVVATRRPMLVVVLHSKAGRTDEMEGVRVSMSRVVLETLKVHDTFRHYIRSLVWMGDFNAGPHSYDGKYPCAWYPQVVKSAPPAASSPNPWVNSVLGLESLLAKANGGDEPPFTTHKMRNGSMITQTIDYILAAAGAYRVVAQLPRHGLANVPSEGFPSVTWGSDHLSIGVDIAHAD